MAVRIPIYEQRGSLNPPLTPTRSVQNISTPDNAFQIAAEGLRQGAGLARELESRDKQAEAESRRLAAEAKHEEEERARTWVGQAMPEFHLARETDLQDMSTKVAPGADGFSRSFSERYNEAAKQLRDSAPSESARRLVDVSLAKTFEHFGGKALAIEKTERVRHQGDLEINANSAAAKVIYSDPSQFSDMFGARQTGLTRNGAFDPATRDKMMDDLRKQTANAAVVGWIDQNVGPASAFFERFLKGEATDAPAEIASPFKLGTLAEQQAWARHAEQKAGAVRQEAQVGLNYEIQNAEAMARDGVAPTGPALKRDAFVSAYKNPEVAEHQWQRYNTARQSAAVGASLKMAPSSDLVKILQANPDPKDKDYAVKSSMLNIQQAAATRILQQRQADPVAYAMQVGDFGFTPIDPSKPEFVGELQKRAASLPVMAAKYGKADVLTKTESQVLARRLDVLPAEQRVAELEKLRAGITDDAVYSSVLQSIRPDSPVTALVGNIAAAGFKDNARYIAAGEDLLNPTKGDKGSDGRGKFAMPKEQLLQQAWVEKVGEAYRGFPDAERTAYQAFKAYYAAQAAARGLNDPMAGPDEGIVSKALAASTGGVTKWKTDWFGNNTPSARVILPYGMPDDKFRDKVSAEWGRLRGDAGYPTTDVTDVGLQNTGANGEYMVMSGTSWMPGKDGKPIILRIK
jgi:AraC-like DNA-binding protein